MEATTLQVWWDLGREGQAAGGKQGPLGDAVVSLVNEVRSLQQELAQSRALHLAGVRCCQRVSDRLQADYDELREYTRALQRACGLDVWPARGEG